MRTVSEQSTLTCNDLPSLLDAGEQLARLALDNDGQVPATLICARNNGETFLVGYDPPSTAYQERALVQQLGEWMRVQGVVRFVVVMECWMTEQNEGRGLPTVRPSQAADRMEALMLEAHDAMNCEPRLFRIDCSYQPPKLIPVEGIKPDISVGIWDRILNPSAAVH